jgi:hypothetical protein
MKESEVRRSVFWAFLSGLELGLPEIVDAVNTLAAVAGVAVVAGAMCEASSRLGRCVGSKR